MDMQDGDVVSTYADTNDFNYKPDTKLADGVEQFGIENFMVEEIKYNVENLEFNRANKRAFYKTIMKNF
jgi:hypothetical protein